MVLTALGAHVPIAEAKADAEKITDSTTNRLTTNTRLTIFLLARRVPITEKRYKIKLHAGTFAVPATTVPSLSGGHGHGRGLDLRHDLYRENARNHGFCRDPTGGRVQTGPDRLPSNLQRTYALHSAVLSTGLPRMARVSSIHRATGNGRLWDTNNRRPRSNPVPALVGGHE